MASKAAHKRLTKEYVTMRKEPPPFVWAVPEEKNILNWHFLIRGPPDSPYAGGEYHGILIFPSEYPFKPPGIKMFTPSGRFQQDKKICFSMSDFHPGSWNPAWSVATILTGLLSFMLSDEMTTGSLNSSDSHKRIFASRSHEWNLTQSKFKEMFPEYATPQLKSLPNMAERERGGLAPPPLLLSTSTTLTTPSTSQQSTRTNTPITPIGPSAPTPAVPSPSSVVQGGSSGGASGAAASWTSFVWQKWRWGLFLALAVLVSRVSSSS